MSIGYGSFVVCTWHSSRKNQSIIRASIDWWLLIIFLICRPSLMAWPDRYPLRIPDSAPRDCSHEPGTLHGSCGLTRSLVVPIASRSLHETAVSLAVTSLWCLADRSSPSAIARRPRICWYADFGSARGEGTLSLFSLFSLSLSSLFLFLSLSLSLSLSYLSDSSLLLLLSLLLVLLFVLLSCLGTTFLLQKSGLQLSVLFLLKENWLYQMQKHKKGNTPCRKVILLMKPLKRMCGIHVKIHYHPFSYC